MLPLPRTVRSSRGIEWGVGVRWCTAVKVKNMAAEHPSHQGHGDTSEPPVAAGYPEHPELAHPPGQLPGLKTSHRGHEDDAMATGAVGQDIHSTHADHDAAGGHDKHAGHSVEMFQQKFWGTFLLSIPTVVWASMIQHWFRYDAPGGALASRWVPAVFGTAVFGYGGWVFIRGALEELRVPLPGMMTLISLAISVAFVFSLAVTLGFPGSDCGGSWRRW